MGDRQHVVIYARISEDPLGLEQGVTRQLEAGRELVAARGWPKAAEHVDNNVSALKGKHRPAYEALMAAVDRGEVDVIVCYQQSRLWRNRQERAEGIERLRRARVQVVMVRGSDLDMSTASGRSFAGMLGEFDTLESEIKAERVQDAARARALAGHANGAVLYGWRREYDTDSRGRVVGFRDLEDPAEADVVREVVDRLLAGHTLRGITADLNARGVPSPQGKEWAHTSVRKVALRPANIARRIHNGEDVGPAAWPALVEDDKHHAVVALLNDPRRRQLAATAFAEAGAASRKYLLTYGVGECGVCGGVLRHNTKRIKRKVARARTPNNPDGVVVDLHELYLCDRKACVGRNRHRVDALVEAVVVGRLGQPDALDLLRAPATDPAGSAAADEVRTLRRRLDEAAEDYAAGLIDREQMRRVTAVLRPQLEEAERQVVTAPGPLPADLRDLVQAPDVAAHWQRLSLVARRGVLDVLCRVVLLPTRRGAGFDPESVRIEWRTT